MEMNLNLDLAGTFATARFGNRSGPGAEAMAGNGAGPCTVNGDRVSDWSVTETRTVDGTGFIAELEVELKIDLELRDSELKLEMHLKVDLEPELKI
jgi:hypothetical protein